MNGMGADKPFISVEIALPEYLAAPVVATFALPKRGTPNQMSPGPEAEALVHGVIHELVARLPNWFVEWRTPSYLGDANLRYHIDLGFTMVFAPRPKNPADIAERTELAHELARALTDPRLKVSTVVLADWAVAPLLNQVPMGAPQQRLPIVALVRAARVAALAPWLAGELPVKNLPEFTTFHTVMGDETAQALAQLSLQSSIDLGGRSTNPGLANQLAALVDAGWVRLAEPVSWQKGPVAKPGRLLRRLLRVEMLAH